MNKYIALSLFLHGALLLGFQWSGMSKSSTTHQRVEVLLMGDNHGDRITENKSARKKAKTIAPVQTTDPDALKSIQEKVVAQEQGTASAEGSFGQGGTKNLEYFAELGAWLNSQKRYPKLAQRLGQECDNIKVEFQVYPDGKLSDIQVQSQCQFEILKQAAVELVKVSSPFRPFPEGFPKTPLKRSYDIQYVLR